VLLASCRAAQVLPMPALSPTMNSGSIAKWIKREGEQARGAALRVGRARRCRPN
jgi:hypothetical protein